MGPWYTAEVQQKRNFYWEHYQNYLVKQRSWDPNAVAKLDDATAHVVERLTNPVNKNPYQAKGLVVGYVQSGKTANFTGVIAKAIDAGYRLIIVLTGTTNLLREQTQRRIDMELVGDENILRGVDIDERRSARRRRLSAATRTGPTESSSGTDSRPSTRRRVRTSTA